MYIIKNKNNNAYFSKHLLGIKHYTNDESEAMSFKDKKEANATMRLFKHKENFEIVKVVK